MCSKILLELTSSRSAAFAAAAAIVPLPLPVTKLAAGLREVAASAFLEDPSVATARTANEPTEILHGLLKVVDGGERHDMTTERVMAMSYRSFRHKQSQLGLQLHFHPKLRH